MAINTTSILSDLVTTAYDVAVDFQFQPNLKFAQLAETKKWELEEAPVPGDAVTFTIFDAMTLPSSPLSETIDPNPQSLSETQESVTMFEYGKLVQRTNKLRLTSFVNVDVAIATMVGNNMGKTVDVLARKAFDSMTASANISYVNSNVFATGVTASDTIGAVDFRMAFNKLSRNDVPPIDGQFYVAVLHPDVLSDLKVETGAGAWRTPKEYVDTENIYNGEVGEFEGFRSIVSTNSLVEISGASGSVDLYSSYFVGFQAVGFAEGQAPQIGFSGPFDSLQRIYNIFWYSLIGYSKLRADSLFTVFSASSYEV